MVVRKTFELLAILVLCIGTSIFIVGLAGRFFNLVISNEFLELLGIPRGYVGFVVAALIQGFLLLLMSVRIQKKNQVKINYWLKFLAVILMVYNSFAISSVVNDSINFAYTTRQGETLIKSKIIVSKVSLSSKLTLQKAIAFKREQVVNYRKRLELIPIEESQRARRNRIQYQISKLNAEINKLFERIEKSDIRIEKNIKEESKLKEELVSGTRSGLSIAFVRTMKFLVGPLFEVLNATSFWLLGYFYRQIKVKRQLKIPKTRPTQTPIRVSTQVESVRGYLRRRKGR